MKRGSENQWPICISSWQWFGIAHGFNQCNEVVVKAVSLVSLGGFVFSWCLRHGTIPDIIVVSKQITTTKKPALVTVHYVLCFLNYEMRWNRFVLFCDWNLGFGFAGKRQLVKAPELSCIWVSVGNLIWVKALLSIYDVVANVWIGLDKFKHRFNLNQYTESHWKCVLEILYHGHFATCWKLKAVGPQNGEVRTASSCGKAGETYEPTEVFQFRWWKNLFHRSISVWAMWLHICQTQIFTRFLNIQKYV